MRRATATVREVEPPELVAGRRRLVCTVRTYRPRWVAIFGVGAYRTSFAHQNAQVGQQDALGDSGVWLLPSPSGANGSYPLVISSVSFARSISQWINQRSPDTTIGHNQPSWPIVPWTGFSRCAALLSAISPMLHRLESFAIWPGNSQQKCRLLQSLHLMLNRRAERQYVARAQVSCDSFCGKAYRPL